MYDPDIINKETEELSRLLDEMNCGRQPESEGEAADLLAVAALVQKAGPPVGPPQHIVDEIVNQAIAPLPSNRLKRFRTWIYSGALGAVASILLIVVLNMMPSWPQEPLDQPGQTQPTDTREISPVKQEEPLLSLAPPAVSQAVQTETVKPAEKTASGPNSPAAAKPADSPVLVAPSPTPALAEKPPAKPAKRAPSLSEQATVSKSAFTPESVADIMPATFAPETIPLSLPGRVPNSVSIDEKTGLVRQVFAQGTPQEIIVTQRRQPPEPTSAKAAKSPDAAPGDENGLTKVTLVIHGQEVTVEGRMTRQELLALAESLTY